MSKNLCRTFRRGRSDYNATHIFFSFLGMKVELEKRLRKPLESGEEQMRRTCVCSFAGCNFAVRRDTVCSRRSVCVRDEHAEGVRGRRSHLLRDVSPRTAETYAETPSALRNCSPEVHVNRRFFSRVCGRSFRLSERISPLRNCRRLIA